MKKLAVLLACILAVTGYIWAANFTFTSLHPQGANGVIFDNSITLLGKIAESVARLVEGGILITNATINTSTNINISSQTGRIDVNGTNAPAVTLTRSETVVNIDALSTYFPVGGTDSFRLIIFVNTNAGNIYLSHDNGGAIITPEGIAQNTKAQFSCPEGTVLPSASWYVTAGASGGTGIVRIFGYK